MRTRRNLLTKAGRKKASPVSKAYSSAVKPFPIVGVGASAGGLEAFTQLLKHLPADSGMGFVLVQHLDPDHESALTQILTRVTSIPICEVTNNLRVERNHIYVIPPKTNMAIAQGVLKLQPRKAGPGPQHSIDFFFESLAHDQRESAIGVILSGSATDGTLGMEAIKAEGGVTLAQDESAKYDSMPRSAISAGCVDFVLSPENIAKELARIARHPYVAGKQEPLVQHSSPSEGESDAAESRHNGFKRILLQLRKHSGVDFSLYKSSTIQRRIARRMMLSKIDKPEKYYNFIRGKPNELEALYSDLLISVTGFFRDPAAFEALREKVFPKLIQQPRDEPVRLWVVGCSTGQEAYSLAIALTEFSEKTGRSRKLRIFATDVNESLLQKGRAGLYTKAVLSDMSQERLRRFFVPEDGGYRIAKFLREMVIFAKQNLIGDPPFSRMDFVSCRNVLIYLDQELQQRILPIFHYALRPAGFLFLGQSESIGPLVGDFEIVDKRYKIFSKKVGIRTPLHYSSRQPAEKKEAAIHQVPAAQEVIPSQLSTQREADRVTIGRFAPAGVLINNQLQVLQFRGDTSPFLSQPAGAASFHLLKMAREGLMLPLRGAITKSKKNNELVRREGVRLSHSSGGRLVNFEVVPLKHLKEQCYLIFFEEAKGRGDQFDPPQLEAPARLRSKASVEDPGRVAELEAEIAEMRDYLQSIQEEAEASNEELQASNEEVNSANEELQSVNEELETSKEELESANEELTTINDEMAARNAELNRSNADLNNLHASVNMGIVLLTRDLAIRRFTPMAEKLFNLVATDIGRPLHNVRHNLELEDLEELLNGVIKTGSQREREVKDRKGRWYSLRIRPYRTLENDVDGAVLVLLDISAIKHGEEQVALARDHSEAILRTTGYPLVVLDSDLRVTTANSAFYKTFKVIPGETVGSLIYDLGNGQWDIPKLREFLQDILPSNSSFEDFEVTHDFESIGRRTMLLNGRRLDAGRSDPPSILLAINDITESKQLEAVRLSEIRYRRLFEAAQDGVLIVDPGTLRITDANPFMTQLLGYSREEFLGKELCEIGLFKNRAACEAAFHEVKKKRFYRSDNLRGNTKAGKVKEFEIISNLYDEGDHQVIQCNIRDITERKQSEELLRLAKDQLAHQAGELERTVRERTGHLRNAVQELEAFSYTISHDMRAPLRAMVGFANLTLIEARNKLNPIVQEHMNRIITAGNRLDRLIQDVLSYSRVMQGEIRLVPVDLEAVIQSVVEQYSGFEAHHLDLKIQRPLLQVLGHEASLTQCIANLLSNAVKFIKPGQVPHVSIWTEKRTTPVLSRADARTGERSGPMVRVWFEDQGIGIAPADQSRIFSMFERVHSSQEFEGTGIGLAIMRKAVERMGGKVGLESDIGQGTKFWFELRAVESE